MIAPVTSPAFIMAEAGAQPAARQGGRGDRRPRRDGDKKAGGARRPYKRRELPPGYEVEVLPEPEEVARPDVEAQRARVGAVEAEIEAAKAERGKLQALIGTRGKRSHGVTSEAKEARDRLNEIRCVRGPPGADAGQEPAWAPAAVPHR